MTPRPGGRPELSSNPGATFLIYAFSLGAFIIGLWILEKIGVPNRILGYLFAGFTLAIYAGIGLACRTMRLSDYYFARRNVPALYNGMAGAGDWISGTVFMTLAGTLYLTGYDGLSYVLGWTGGFVLVAILIAPYLRQFDVHSVPDFLALRFGGVIARLLGLVILLSASFLFLVAQIEGAGLISERFLGLPYTWGIAGGIVAMLLCALLGGMRGATWTQASQYIVLVIAYLIPVAFISYQATGVAVPQIMYGEALGQIAGIEAQMMARGIAVGGPQIVPSAPDDPRNFWTLMLCLMAGTAALPHVLMRTFATGTVRETRKSVNWTLAFIAIVFVTAPAYAAFVKLEIYQTVIGQAFVDLPEWIYAWGVNGRVMICGQAASSFEAVASACRTAGTDIVRLGDFVIETDAIVIAAPEIAGLPYVVTAMVGAGAIAAVLSTADGLLVTMANALSHDLYHKCLDRNAPTGRRLFVARLSMIALVGAGAFAATTSSPDILKLVAWAFSLAAAGLFPAIVLGIWWDRCTSAGAVAGMIAGFAITLAYIVFTEPAPFGFGNPTIFGIGNVSAGFFGLPVGFAVMIAVSMLTAKPSAALRDMLDRVRPPKGRAVR